MIKISIIIPYYNGEISLIRKALDSVVLQFSSDSLDMNEVEAILIDDGSSQSFADQLDAIIPDYPFIKLLRQKNAGASIARNNGIRIASGKYIAFLDSDDVLVEGFLSEALSIAEKADADMVLGMVYRGKKMISKPHGSKLINIYTKNKEKLLKHMISYKSLLHMSDGSYISRTLGAKLIRREIASKVLFPAGLVYGEDCIYLLDCINLSKKIVLTDNLWYFYYANNDSICNRINPNIVNDVYLKHKQVRERLPLTSPMHIHIYMELFLEDMTMLHRNLLYSRVHALNKAELKKERERVYNMYDHLIPDFLYIPLGIGMRFEYTAFKHRFLFSLYDIFRDIRRLVHRSHILPDSHIGA